jgi:hypothetical protein
VGVARLLLDRGADVERHDVDGRSALLWACMRGHLQMVRLLVERGADMESSSHDGRTGLMWACATDHEPIVQLLLSYGVAIRRMDCEGDTALSLAERRGFESIGALLRTHGTEWWRARQLMILLSRELMMLREYPPWERMQLSKLVGLRQTGTNASPTGTAKPNAEQDNLEV